MKIKYSKIQEILEKDQAIDQDLIEDHMDLMVQDQEKDQDLMEDHKILIYL